MPNTVAHRIRQMIEAARHHSAASGRALDLAAIYGDVLVRCGVCREDAIHLVADAARDPVETILFYAGEAHNFAILAVEEVLAAAQRPRAA
jgi:hypothetical protein